jgi:hypothetical protein
MRRHDAANSFHVCCIIEQVCVSRTYIYKWLQVLAQSQHGRDSVGNFGSWRGLRESLFVMDTFHLQNIILWYIAAMQNIIIYAGYTERSKNTHYSLLISFHLYRQQKYVNICLHYLELAHNLQVASRRRGGAFRHSRKCLL